MADDYVQQLRDEVSRLLAAGVQSDADHAIATADADERHRVEVDELHDTAAATSAAHQVHDAKMAHDRDSDSDYFELSLQSRDLVGQAKGVLIVAMPCTGEAALQLLLEKSRADNRTLTEIAAEIVARAELGAVER
jgi:hypothetical protein